MTNFKKLSILTSLLLSLIGCQVTIPPAQDSSTSNNSTNAKTLTILDAKALKGSEKVSVHAYAYTCLLYTSPSPRDATLSRMPSSA